MNLVSICIPTYNGAHYLSETLDSIICQSIKNFEIIIGDDCSQDHTLKIISNYQSKIKQSIRLIKNSKRLGIGANWNNTITQAKGKYVKMLFQDDVMAPNCLEILIETLESDPTIGLIASKRDFIINKDYRVEAQTWLKLHGNLQKSLMASHFENGILDKSFIRSKLFFTSPLNKIGEPSCTMFRRDLLQKVGYFNVNLKQKLDYEFYYRLLKHSHIKIIEEKLISIRLHGNQATVKNSKNNLDETSLYEMSILKNLFWQLSYQQRLMLIDNQIRNFVKGL